MAEDNLEFEDLSEVFDKRQQAIAEVNAAHDEEVAAISKDHAVAAVKNEAVRANMVKDIMQADFTEDSVADMIGDAHLPFDVQALTVSSEIGISCESGDCDEKVGAKPGLGNFLNEVLNRLNDAK